MRKSINLIILLSIIVLFSGCSIAGLLEKSVPSQDLVIRTSIDSTNYIYKDSVIVSHSADKDELSVKNESRNGNTYSYLPLFKGDFDRVGWYNDVLCIQVDDKYYTFDINAFIKDENFHLVEHDKSTMENEYRNFENLFYWREF